VWFQWRRRWRLNSLLLPETVLQLACCRGCSYSGDGQTLHVQPRTCVGGSFKLNVEPRQAVISRLCLYSVGLHVGLWLGAGSDNRKQAASSSLYLQFIQRCVREGHLRAHSSYQNEHRTGRPVLLAKCDLQCYGEMYGDKSFSKFYYGFQRWPQSCE
jgi:hypothetical protein